MATTSALRAAAAPRCRRAARAPLPPRAVFGGDKGADAPAPIKRWPEEVAPAGVRSLAAPHRTRPRQPLRRSRARCRAGGAAAGEAHQEAAAVWCAPAPAAPRWQRALPTVHPKLTRRLISFLFAGFVDQAETINSRAAMIGFFALLLVEAVRCGARTSCSSRRGVQAPLALAQCSEALRARAARLRARGCLTWLASRPATASTLASERRRSARPLARALGHSARGYWSVQTPSCHPHASHRPPRPAAQQQRARRASLPR